MIIKHYNSTFTIQFESSDWEWYFTWDLNSIIKSIPYPHRKFFWSDKKWLINNNYLSILDEYIRFPFTDAEEQAAIVELEAFNALFSQ